jgi:hypothetical protein
MFTNAYRYDFGHQLITQHQCPPVTFSLYLREEDGNTHPRSLHDVVWVCQLLRALAQDSEAWVPQNKCQEDLWSVSRYRVFQGTSSESPVLASGVGPLRTLEFTVPLQFGDFSATGGKNQQQESVNPSSQAIPATI